MVVTDPTIDPITGLPVLNPQDVIQQIPLGVQTFPYEDMQATARPTRNPLYGDDILPVSAFVAGQHPSTGSAQTVETDGNHAMKVTMAGDSGVGAPIALQWHGYMQANDVTSNTIFLFEFEPTDKLIYRVQVAALLRTLVTGYDLVMVQVALQDGTDGTGSLTPIGVIGLSEVGKTFSTSWEFPFGLDLVKSGFVQDTYSLFIYPLGGDVTVTGVVVPSI